MPYPNKKEILKDITFSCCGGETLGIIGQNGAGKSTLFKILVGIIKPTDGNVLINNTNPWLHYPNIANKIGFMIENPALYENLTGYENLQIYFKMQGIDISYFNDKIIDYLDIKNYLYLKVNKYSLGMKQRLAIACSLIHNPEIIILDEPTNSLDAIGVKQIRELIQQLNRDKKIVVIASHMLKEIQDICTSCIIINNGIVVDTFHSNYINEHTIYKIKFKCNNIKIINNILEKYDFLDLNENSLLICSNKSLEKSLRILLENNISILDIDSKKDALEDYFLRKVVEVNDK